MKSLTLLAVGSILVGSTSAMASLHCEKQVNDFLSVYANNPRTADLAKPISAKDFSKSRSVGKPTGNVFEASYNARTYVSDIKITGISSADMKKPVVISVSGYHQNPDENAKGFTGLLPDLEVKLGADCKLQSFTVYDFKTQGSKYTNKPVAVTGNACLGIFGKSKFPDGDILKTLKVPADQKNVYMSRVIPNCRHNSKASDDPKISVPIMARLSADAETLTKVFPPARGPDNCPSCKPQYKRAY
ncbi:MAG: hypothetical protein JST80_11785 [Bdellovibrionales bacterium]|nr:hypothetical protein [Bdellovibrionales bacterium]